MLKNKLLKARLNKGASQEEIADLVGMSQPNYSRREKGLKKISDIEWIKLAKVLGVKKEDIYEAEDEVATVVANNSCKSHHFNVPDFVIEHIEFLKEENKELKEKLKKYEI
ncbi:hypothetical protein B0A75_09730 [Flavobacterium oncorhynchi]|uniref:HTH cro/C1-type domain-containing protein n=1 Tax=Flavobacterium oncorhynchi TaxID=728056 RepID=A0A226HZY2_9FLAO|nr:helix-turn-helix transcriptional regulator [Flavobacterium oncorhynchi]OXA99795.1 hypothetical protein B0A75_09730 [Flavobacterium oncorhynchi]